MNRDYYEMISNARRAIDDARATYRSADEVSLLFANEVELDYFVEWVRDERNFLIQNFNSTSDTMTREDKDESFVVRFEFCRLREEGGEADWRIEAMCIVSGKAPLHERALFEHGNGVVVHISWKHQLESVYECYLDPDVQALVKGKPQVVAGNPDHFCAAYGNSYGRFSYWGSLPYLKPRVNLRDQAAIV